MISLGVKYVRSRGNLSTVSLCTRVARVGNDGEIFTVHGEKVDPRRIINNQQVAHVGDYLLYSECVNVLELWSPKCFEESHKPQDDEGIKMFSFKFGRLAVYAHADIFGPCVAEYIGEDGELYRSIRNSNLYWRV